MKLLKKLLDRLEHEHRIVGRIIEASFDGNGRRKHRMYRVAESDTVPA
jgi:hypothetical protein